jgi:shikimate kinase
MISVFMVLICVNLRNLRILLYLVSVISEQWLYLFQVRVRPWLNKCNLRIVFNSLYNQRISFYEEAFCVSFSDPEGSNHADYNRMSNHIFLKNLLY